MHSKTRRKEANVGIPFTLILKFPAQDGEECRKKIYAKTMNTNPKLWTEDKSNFPNHWYIKRRSNILDQGKGIVRTNIRRVALENRRTTKRANERIRSKHSIYEDRIRIPLR